MKFKRVSRKRTRPPLNAMSKVKLPADYPWKVLSWMVRDLSDSISEDDEQLLNQIIRDRDQAALQNLTDCWGLQSINTQQSCHLLHEVRARYQLSTLIKKFQFSGDVKLQKANALKKFYQAEANCLEYNLKGYIDFAFSESEFGAEVLSSARSFLEKVLGAKAPSNELVTRWSRHGPGANLDTRKGKISLYDKYKNLPYGCTRAALPYAQFLIQSDKRWLRALEHWYCDTFLIEKCRIISKPDFWSKVLKVVEGNRITFVPKDADNLRTIAIEPPMNLMLQLGVDGYIRKRLKRFDIDLDSQSKNQFMAFLGSLNEDSDNYVTFDMKMASDSIALKLVELLVPDEWNSYLLKLRSPKGVIEGDKLLTYSKISSMGNGFTFALESAIFAALCYAVIKTKQKSVNMKKDLAVFGDDLIVRKDVSIDCVRYLKLSGFMLNEDKSFLKGPIRESCGTDWLQGKPLRPVFLKEYPTDTSELFTDINRLRRTLELRFGIRDSNTVKNMLKWVPEKFRNIVGPCSDTTFDSYIHASDPNLLSNRARVRWKDCMWNYKVLLKAPIVTTRGSNFHFRKLMHDLRGSKSEQTGFEQLISWKRDRKFHSWKVQTGGEGRFAVLKSYSSTVLTTYSRTNFWCDMYAEEATVAPSGF